MARLRTIKPEFWVSEQIAECSPSARLTFIGLWNFCDDRGVHPAKPRTLKAELYPMDDITVGAVSAWVEELLACSLLGEFTGDDGERYWYVTGWDKHQKIDRPTFKHPEPPHDSPSTRRVIGEASQMARSGVETSGVETNGDETSGEVVARPRSRRTSGKQPLPAGFTVSARVKAWAEEKGFTRLEEHLDAFKTKALAKGYVYADWDAALVGAIRDDWAGLRTGKAQQGGKSGAGAAFDGSVDLCPSWAIEAGFATRFEAENAGCNHHNYQQFKNGKKQEAA